MFVQFLNTVTSQLGLILLGKSVSAQAPWLGLRPHTSPQPTCTKTNYDFDQNIFLFTLCNTYQMGSHWNQLNHNSRVVKCEEWI